MMNSVNKYVLISNEWATIDWEQEEDLILSKPWRLRH